MVGVTTAVAALCLTGSASAWYFNTTRNTPEAIFYQALSKESTDITSSMDESYDSDDTKLRAQGIAKSDLTFKIDGAISCRASSPGKGDMTIEMRFRQVQEEIFAIFDTFKISNTSSKNYENYVNDLLKSHMTNKWAILEDADKSALGLKDHGVIFAHMGAWSVKKSTSQVVEAYKKHKVATIHRSTQKTVNGKPAIEYELIVRRAAYDKFIGTIQPDFDYKDAVLDNLFDGDSVDITLTVDKKSKTIITQTYTMENICRDLVDMLSEDAARTLPKRVRIKNTPDSNGTTVEKLEKPAEYVTMEDLTTPLYEALYAE